MLSPGLLKLGAIMTAMKKPMMSPWGKCLRFIPLTRTERPCELGKEARRQRRHAKGRKPGSELNEQRQHVTVIRTQETEGPERVREQRKLQNLHTSSDVLSDPGQAELGFQEPSSGSLDFIDGGNKTKQVKETHKCAGR